MTMQWREVSLAEVLDHFQGKRKAEDWEEPSDKLGYPGGVTGGVTRLFLDDGSAVVASSDWCCTESASWGKQPRFWIGTPVPDREGEVRQ